MWPIRERQHAGSEIDICAFDYCRRCRIGRMSVRRYIIPKKRHSILKLIGPSWPKRKFVKKWMCDMSLESFANQLLNSSKFQNCSHSWRFWLISYRSSFRGWGYYSGQKLMFGRIIFQCSFRWDTLVIVVTDQWLWISYTYLFDIYHSLLQWSSPCVSWTRNSPPRMLFANAMLHQPRRSNPGLFRSLFRKGGPHPR